MVVADRFAELERAWNAADGHAFGAGFAADADFVDIRGAHHRGREAIAAGHHAILGSTHAGSVVRYRVVDARVVAPGCIVGGVEATLDAPAGPLQGVHDARITAVLTDTGDRWEVTAFHNTLVQA
jgi:uncharacterized protein (TIGR02246 family)